jgi:hypothetical protein
MAGVYFSHAESRCKIGLTISGIPRHHGVLMAESPLTLTEIEGRMAAIRENIRELIEQAAAYSGAADDELVSQRISEQEAQLEILTRQRDELLQRKKS